MKVCGIICEYNPFHTGHEYHIKQARKKTGADCVVAIMSGNFTQRGDAAFFDKWLRARCAILGGADIVIELPFCFAAQTAEFFALGAVKMLEECGCIDYLAFGCETDDLKALENAALITADKNVKAGISSGKSYPAALSGAKGGEILSPNNILAIEYIRALKTVKSKITPVCIKREGEGYNSDRTDGKFISASACRRLFETGDFKTLKKYIPHDIFAILQKCTDNGRFCKSENLSSYVLGTLRSTGIFADGAYVSEGIENRINSAAVSAVTLDGLYDTVKTKRYTMARIKRIILNGILGVTDTDIKKYIAQGCLYLNILDSNSAGYAFINNVKESSDITIISKMSDSEKLSGIQKEIYDLDFKSSLIYYLGMENKKYRAAGTEIMRGRDI